jgi:hypothetical protein
MENKVPFERALLSDSSALFLDYPMESFNWIPRREQGRERMRIDFFC